MDVKRLLLLIPLAVLAYLLVVQWNQDYGQPNYDSVPETTQRSNQYHLAIQYHPAMLTMARAA